jgi:hypothetical protein
MRGKSQIWLQVTEDSRHFLNPEMFWQPQRTQSLDMTTFMFFCSKCGKLEGILKESRDSFLMKRSVTWMQNFTEMFLADSIINFYRFEVQAS